jgi:hypothetical protein
MQEKVHLSFSSDKPAVKTDSYSNLGCCLRGLVYL